MNQQIRREQVGMCLMSGTMAKPDHREKEVLKRGGRELWMENMTGQTVAL